jgi:flagellar hook-associated protein 2
MATTTSTTSSTSTSSASVSSTNFLTTLGAGSGIDTKSLATNLAQAEINPRKDVINTKITKTEARISGYGALKYALSDLKTAFEKLKNASDFSAIKPSISQTSAFGVTTDATAAPGDYSVNITQVAQATRWASAAIPSTTTNLNGGQSFSLTFSSAPSNPITVSADTPAGVIAAVNAQTETTGISAQLIKSGTGTTIVFTGKEGASNDFSVSSTASALTLQSTALQIAQDAQLSINGIDITNDSNTLSDVLPGVTLNLYAATTGSAKLGLNQETSTIKDNIKALVTSYNTFSDSLGVLGDSKSTVEQYGGALAGDSLLGRIKSQVRSLVTGDYALHPDASTTSNPNVSAAWQAGLSFDRNGKLTLDETKLDSALKNHPTEVMTLFSAGKNNLSVYSTEDAGLAGTAVRSIDAMIRSTGLITEQTNNATKQVTAYKDELTKLDDRMQALLNRYLQQFSAMDSIVGNSNSLKTSLKSSFDGMAAVYSNK